MFAYSYLIRLLESGHLIFFYVTDFLYDIKVGSLIIIYII